MNKNVKNNDTANPATAKIFSLSHDGRGITTVNNKKIFISGALPGEVATYKLVRQRSHYAEAHALEILTVSPQRNTPPCDHFGICGGCSLQHMTMQLQLEIKQETLLNQLKHFGQVEPQTILPPLNASTIAYRRKARLGVKYVYKKNKLLVGFREKASSYLAELEHCLVLHPKIGEHLIELAQVVMSLSIYDQVPQIEMAMGDDDTALIFRFLKPCLEDDLKKLIEFGEKYQIQIYLQPGSKTSVYKLWPQDGLEYITYTLPDQEITFRFHPLDFTQINLEMNRLMVNQALSLLAVEPHESVLDLFCGIGNFSLPIAHQAKQVIGIEGSADMVSRAKQNATLNRIENTDFLAADLTNLQADTSWIKHYDKLLLDPPRTGAKEILPYFKQFSPKRIVYVSCNPATLARDIGELVHVYGFTFKQVGILNMFPHTTHIEAMAVLE